jgi:hypothetical protein
MSSGLRDFFTKISTRRFFIRAGMARFARIVVRDYPHRSRSGTQARPADRAPRARTKVKSARESFAFLIPAHCVSCRRICLDWASETTGFPHEVCEMALAHVIANKAEAACRRGDLFAKRRKLMSAWASYCATLKAAKVVPLRKQALAQARCRHPIGCLVA